MDVIGVISTERKKGKTLTVENLVKELKGRGYSVATVKHIPRKNFTLDREGSDTWKHARAGADLVVGASKGETAFLVQEGRGLGETLGLMESLGSYDFAIVEGFKRESIPQIVVADSREEAEVLTGENTIAVVAPSAPEGHSPEVPFISMEEAEKLADLLDSREFRLENIVNKLPGLDCGECGSSSCREMAEFILQREKSFADCVVLQAGKEVEISIGGREVPLGGFVQDFVKNVVTGMVSTLKKAEAREGEEVVVRVRYR